MLIIFVFVFVMCFILCEIVVMEEMFEKKGLEDVLVVEILFEC